MRKTMSHFVKIWSNVGFSVEKANRTQKRFKYKFRDLVIMMQKRITRIARAIYRERRRRITPIRLMLNDPNLVEVTEPYVQVSGQFAGYIPEEGLILLQQTIVVYSRSIMTVNDEINHGDRVRVMLDENGTARMVREPKFWSTMEGLLNHMKQLGYAIPITKSSTSVVRRIPRSRSP